jgi:3-methylcrotonyl-CoA carboxylase alpha subunit/acetyl-CoA/propionyl-CoA carboxylase biotin carboxyl carrier protein
VDAALRSGQEVTTFYDPLLGKVIAHGTTREAARARLVAALDDTAILGITTNLGWARDLVASDAFRDALVDTAWLDRRPPPPTVAPPAPVLCAAAWAATAPAQSTGDAWAAGDGWRAGGPPAPATIELERDGERHRLRVDRAAGVIEAGSDRFAVRGPNAVDDGEPFALEVDGERHELLAVRTAHALCVAHHGHAFAFRPPGESAHETTAPSDGAVVAPMPGTILSVEGEIDGAVRAGQTVVVMEAMKMELALTAPFDGGLAELGVAAGERVALGHPLFRVERDDG